MLMQSSYSLNVIMLTEKRSPRNAQSAIGSTISSVHLAVYPGASLLWLSYNLSNQL